MTLQRSSLLVNWMTRFLELGNPVLSERVLAAISQRERLNGKEMLLPPHRRLGVAGGLPRGS